MSWKQCCEGEAAVLREFIVAAVANGYNCRPLNFVHELMRTRPQDNGWRIGPMLAAGLTLGHYKSFQECRRSPD